MEYRYEENSKTNEDQGTMELASVDVKQGQEALWQEQKKWFLKIGPASLLYALLFVLCEYDNNASIMTPIWTGGTCYYVYYLMKHMNRALKRDSGAMIVIMVLLGVSSFLTGNDLIQLFNIAGFFVLLIYFLLHNFNEDQNWGFGKVFIEMLAAILGAVLIMPLPFEESMACIRLREKKMESKHYGALIGIALAMPMALIVCMCLGEADAVFASLLKNMVKFSRIEKVDDDMIMMPLMLLFGFFSSYCGMRYMAMSKPKKEQTERRRYSASIAISFTGIFTVMYLVFSVIQIVYLFLGCGKLPNGLTYASYARTGFFQLLFVTIMNLFLVLIMKGCFEKHTILNIMLYTICFCTIIMAASSGYRMLLYISCYHLTFARILVLVTLTVISALIGGIILYLAKSSFPLLRYSIVVISFSYLAFSLSHVDYWIATYNIEHITEENQEEVLDYVKNLSTDAAPAIMKYVKDNGLEEDIRKSYRYEEKQEHYDDRHWYLLYADMVRKKAGEKSPRKWNLSYFIASKVLLEESTK